ncbi:unnamed protein product [Allacma fusca]|uniref:Uncharacterized protein n=1 Tax=Allacma fusca TaxID=39272 RepID=A0A8J2KT66_9HEXA|nr:unnamed protein product [Allacma fusca]
MFSGTHVATGDKYDVEFVRRVYSSQIVQSVKELVATIEKGPPTTAEFRLTYRTREGFTLLAKKLEIMEDLRVNHIH